MPLVNYSLPNLLQGVSQQPDPLRYDAQCAEQLNMQPSIVEGLTRRPYSTHEFELEESAANIGELPEGSKVHFIKTRSDENYALIHTGTDLYIYNLSDGTLCDIIVGGSGTGSYSIPADHYLELETDAVARDEIRALTVADTTFLLNRQVDVAMSEDTTDELEKKALIFCKQGDYSKKYDLVIEGDFAGSETVGSQAQLTCSVKAFRGGTGNQYYYWGIDDITIVDGGAGYDFERMEWYFTSNLTNAYLIKPEIEFELDANGTITDVYVYNGGKWKADGQWGTTPTISIWVAFPTDITSTSPADGVYTVLTSSGPSSAVTNANSDVIMSQVKTNIDTTLGAGQTTTQYGNLLVFEKIDDGGGDGARHFGIRAQDSLSGRGLGVVYRRVDDLTDLPTFAINDFRVEVAGDAETGVDDYWVIFKTADGKAVGNGHWQECPAPLSRTKIIQSTMPMKLTLTDLNEFTLTEMTVEDRKCGDDLTNPFPSFVGTKIKNMFFFKNRLGFIMDNVVSMTEAGLGPAGEGGLAYNFFRITCSQLLDTDPIDVAVTSTNVVNLEFAITAQDRLLLFADGQQFVLRGADILTPQTVDVAPVTGFGLDPLVAPSVVGDKIYFPFTRGGFSGLRELDVDIEASIYRGEEVTQQIPRYIPKNIRQFAGSTTEGVMAVQSDEDPYTMFVNTVHFENNQKLLNSWGKIQLPMIPRGMTFIESDLYVVGSMPYEVSDLGTPIYSVPIPIKTSDPLVYEATISFAGAHGLSVDDKVAVQNFTGTFGTSGITRTLKHDPTIGAKIVTVTEVPTTTSFKFEIPIADLELGDTTGGGTEKMFTIAWEAHCIKLSYQSGLKDEVGVNAYMDFRVTELVPASTGSFTVPFKLPWWCTLSINNGDRGQHVVGPTISGNTVTLGFTYVTAEQLYAGIHFDSEYTFSEQLFKAPQGSAQSPIMVAKDRIRQGRVYVSDSGDFDVDVTTRNRDTVTTEIDVSDLDGVETIGWLGGGTIQSGVVPFVVGSRGEDTTITVKAKNSLPLNLQTAEFELLVETTSERYGRS